MRPHPRGERLHLFEIGGFTLCEQIGHDVSRTFVSEYN